MSISPLSGTSSLSQSPVATSDGPELVYARDGSPWIPQGQGIDEGRRQVLTTYNDGDGRVILSVQAMASTSGELKSVKLGGEAADSEYALPGEPPGKGGGVATDGEYVYVADTESIYVYRQADIQAAAANICGDPVPAYDRIMLPDGVRASFLNIGSDGQLYVGEFKSTKAAIEEAANLDGWGEQGGDVLDALNPFNDDSVGEFFSDLGDAAVPGEVLPDFDIEQPRMTVFDIRSEPGSFDADEPLRSFEIPFDAQGVAQTDNGLLFTRSYGSFDINLHGVRVQSPRELAFLPSDGSDDGMAPVSEARTAAQIDYYAEGVNIVDGKVWITYEGAADEYRDRIGDDEVHGNIQKIDVDDLDIAAEDLGIDPQS